MLPVHLRSTVALSAGLLLAGVLAAPVAVAAVPASTAANAYSGFSDGSVLAANAANLPPVDAAKSEIGQSAAGVALPGTLVTRDRLQQPLLSMSTAGKSAYGHGAGVSVGVLGGVTDPPQVAESTAEATSPAPSSAQGVLVNLPADPLATANVLPSKAAASTTADGSCVLGKDLSNGEAHVADVAALSPTPTSPVVTVGTAAPGGVSDSVSRTYLAVPTTGAGRAVTTGKSGLVSQTTQVLAPIRLFTGTPAALTITLLGPLQLSAAAGGVPGTSVVTYGVPGKSGTTPVLTISGGGSTQTLTADQVFGAKGIVLPLGVADVTIGAPAHALTGREGTPVSVNADGTSASAAADFVRVTLPGALATPGTDPISGPLSPLNQVVNPVLAGLDPLLSGLQKALTDAGLNVADVRVGHVEASSTVPVGGIDCGTLDNPLDESMKDVSALNVAPGQTFTYDVRVPNRGATALTNVTVKDTYADGLEFVSSVPAPTSRGVNTLTYTYDSIAPNDVRVIVLTFRVPAGAAAGTAYRNDAVITGTYAGQPVTRTVGVPGPTVTPVGTGPCDLSRSTKYASNTRVTTGENFGYFVNVLNSGGSACQDVVVTDRLVDGVSFVSCTGGCTHSGQALTWRLGTIQAGASRVLSVVVHTTATSGTLPNTAVITPASGTSGNPSTAGPTVGSTTVPAPGRPASGGTSSGVTAAPGALPRTGLSTGTGSLALILMIGAGGGLLLRRRTS